MCARTCAHTLNAVWLHVCTCVRGCMRNGPCAACLWLIPMSDRVILAVPMRERLHAGLGRDGRAPRGWGALHHRRERVGHVPPHIPSCINPHHLGTAAAVWSQHPAVIKTSLPKTGTAVRLTVWEREGYRTRDPDLAGAWRQSSPRRKGFCEVVQCARDLVLTQQRPCRVPPPWHAWVACLSCTRHPFMQQLIFLASRIVLTCILSRALLPATGSWTSCSGLCPLHSSV